VLGRAVAHGDEIGQHGAVADDGEVALVLLHDRDEHLFGQVEIRVVEAAPQRGGLFNQVGHFVQQRRVIGDLATDLCRLLRNLGRDRLPAGRPVDHHLVLGHEGQIRVRTGNGELGRARSARAARRAAGNETRVREGHDRLAPQRYEPANGT